MTMSVLELQTLNKSEEKIETIQYKTDDRAKIIIIFCNFLNEIQRIKTEL